MLAGRTSRAWPPDPEPMLISRYFDRVAIVLSTVCIVHCLTIPVVVAVLPVLALTWGLNDVHFHTLML